MRNLAEGMGLDRYYEVLSDMFRTPLPLLDSQRPFQSLAAVLTPTPQSSVPELWKLAAYQGAIPLVLRERGGQPVLLLADWTSGAVFVVLYPDADFVEYMPALAFLEFVATEGAYISSDDARRVQEAPGVVRGDDGSTAEDQRDLKRAAEFATPRPVLKRRR